MKQFSFILLIFFLWRLLLFLPIFTGNQYVGFRKGYEYTRLQYYNYSFAKSSVNSFMISPWANFDGVAYLGIAGYGYSTGNARFFPLYPLLVQGATSVFGGAKPYELKQFLIAISLSNIFFILALWIFYKLILLDYSKKIALLSIIFLLVFPTSFFFGSVYTESLFLLLSLLSFYFARKKQWVLASIFGILLSATRIVGVAIFPVLLFEFYKQEKVKKITKSVLLKVLPLFIIPLGLFSFMYYCFLKWNNFLFFVTEQGAVKNGRSVSSAVFIPQTVFRYIKILLTVSPRTHFEWYIALLEFASFLFGCLLFIVAWKKRIRSSYILFALLCFLLPTLSGTFTGLPRYVVILFPLFIALALVRNKVVQGVYLVICAIILFFALMYFSRGFFIA